MEEKLLRQDMESIQEKNSTYSMAKEIHDLVDRAEDIRHEIQSVDVMNREICGPLTMDAKKHNNFNLSTITVNQELAELVLKITGIVLETEMRFIENDIKQKLEEIKK